MSPRSYDKAIVAIFILLFLAFLASLLTGCESVESVPSHDGGVEALDVDLKPPADFFHVDLVPPPDLTPEPFTWFVFNGCSLQTTAFLFTNGNTTISDTTVSPAEANGSYQQLFVCADVAVGSDAPVVCLNTYANGDPLPYLTTCHPCLPGKTAVTNLPCAP